MRNTRIPTNSYKQLFKETMLLPNSRLIRTYVRIVALYHKVPWTINDFEALYTLHILIGTRKGIVRYLMMSTISEEKKYEFMTKAIDDAGLHTLLEPLIQLLA